MPQVIQKGRKPKVKCFTVPSGKVVCEGSKGAKKNFNQKKIKQRRADGRLAESRWRYDKKEKPDASHPRSSQKHKKYPKKPIKKLPELKKKAAKKAIKPKPKPKPKKEVKKPVAKKKVLKLPKIKKKEAPKPKPKPKKVEKPKPKKKPVKKEKSYWGWKWNNVVSKRPISRTNKQKSIGWYEWSFIGKGEAGKAKKEELDSVRKELLAYEKKKFLAGRGILPKERGWAAEEKLYYKDKAGGKTKEKKKPTKFKIKFKSKKK